MALEKYSVSVTATYVGSIEVWASSPESAKSTAMADVKEFHKPVDLEFSAFAGFDLGEKESDY